MKHTTMTWFVGTLILLGLSYGALTPHWDTDGWRSLIRLTARTSLILFLAAYTAEAIWRLWPTAATEWIRSRRAQWGWLFLTSHALHLVGIVAFWRMDPAGFANLVPTATLFSGGLAYLFLVAMGLTSPGVGASWLGRPLSTRIHTWGMHYLFLSFLLANGKRVPIDGWYLVPVLALLLSVTLRFLSRQKPATPPLAN